ncbi:sugar lactone lactonase YvrE [Marinobacter oulmenensis]|uniref:Sugar lactone lactonase YvrE n=2 Tax=Marinobacter oulmenensis TaxID=643747 RepID=A0A840U6W9_9GAMM|nr:sugar lactone lactonase YvrE [Marinobacter oulmenensis]
MMKWFLMALLVVFVLLGGFLLTPSPIDSKAWKTPAPPAMTGTLAPNERLRLSELLARGQVSAPEDVAVASDGTVYTGTADGWIVRILPSGQTDRWLQTGGRPLGLVFDGQGNLIVADAERGLLSVTPSGDITTLTREARGTLFRLTDDVDVASDGRIYFTDASSRFSLSDYTFDLLEMRPHGRLLRYDPATGRTEVLLGNLHFANGVVVSPDGSYALVSETWKYRILKYWITGPRAGQAEVFAANLAGFPDNLSVDSDGRYWVAFPALRDRSIDAMHGSPWLKDLVAKLPERLRPQPKSYGLVVAYDDQGKALISLQDTRGSHLGALTSVTPVRDGLYFGSLHKDRIGWLPFKAIPGLGEQP